MSDFNFDKSYSQKSNAVRDMRAAIKAGQFQASELEVVVVPSGYQIVRTEIEAPAANVVPLRMPEPEKVVEPEPEVVAIRVRYATIDGVNKVRSFKTLAAARKFAQQWVGPHPEIGTGYAVAGDGVGKVTVQGATLAELFPEDAQPAPEVAPAAPTPPAPEAPAGLSDAATAVLRALVRANVWKERGLRPAERVGVWVRSASVHDSATPHGLEPRQVPPAVAALKRAGMVECGFDKAPTVRLTAAGLAAAQASR